MSVACITGASSGIGAACAKRLYKEGFDLVLYARRPDPLKELQRHFDSERCYVATLDVRDRVAVEHAFREIPERFAEIDVLINNAGLARAKVPLQAGSLDDWDEMVHTNISGVLYVTRSVLPGMITRQKGHIVTLGSLAGHEAYAGGAVYCGTKAFVEIMSRALKMDLLGTPIRVSSVDPGMVETEFSVTRFHGDNAQADKVYEGMTPLSAHDVADVIHFCISRPPHVNLSDIVMLPTDQSSSTMVHRRVK